jgi:hypothetical protein
MNIKNASLTVADFPNGLTQINGAVCSKAAAPPFGTSRRKPVGAK